MFKQFEERIETRYCNLIDDYVTHKVKYQILHTSRNPDPFKIPINILCYDQQTGCDNCELVKGRGGEKHYE